jgi:hypothetical protein
MRRSFPQIRVIPVVVVWAATRVGMGCRLEYECGQGGFLLAHCLSEIPPHRADSVSALHT